MINAGRALMLPALLLFLLCPASQAALTFGVVPQQSAQKLARNWGPICTYLSEKTGIDVRFATAPAITEFEHRLAEGRYDFAYMNPYHYTVFSKTPGYLAIARQKDKKITGIIVVNRDAPYNHLSDLNGKTLAFPSPAAFAASILTRRHFQAAGISITPKYVNSHDSVYHNVAQGFYEAGGGVERTFMNIDPDVRKNLKILWKTNSYTPHAIAAHPRVTKAIRHRLRNALIMMNDDSAARSLLKAINFNGFTAAADSDWNDVRDLGIEMINKD